MHRSYMEIIRLTGKTIPWFAPLLPDDLTARLAREETLFLLGAVEEKTACGVLAFSVGETVEIEYLAVSDEFRRRGAANAMLSFLCAHAARTLAPVFCTFAAADKDDPLYLFFAERDDFTVTAFDEVGRMCVTRAQLEESSRLAQIGSRGITVTRFFDRPRLAQRAFLNGLLRSGVFHLRDSAVYNGLIQPLCLTAGADNDLQAAVFVGRGQEAQELTLTLAWSAPGCSAALMALLAALRELLLREMTPDSTLVIDAVESSSYAIVSKLFPQAVCTAQYYQAVWDMDAAEGGMYDAAWVE